MNKENMDTETKSGDITSSSDPLPVKSNEKVVTDTVNEKNIRKFVWKNTFAMSFAFMLNYTSYTGLGALQSSLHVQEGMGTICTSIRYISLVISTLFVPKLMIRGIGHKWTITVSLLGFIVWMAANGYGVWATMVPASIINGIFVAPLWAAQGSYFTEIAKLYAAHTKQNQEGVITVLFGIFYMFYCGSAVFGNIISTTVLKASPPDNYTGPSEDEISELCGMNDCPWNVFNNTNLDKPADNIVWTLVGIYIAIAVCAILISIFIVDNLPQQHIPKDKKPFKEEFTVIMTSTVKLMTRRELWLLVPLTFYTGIEETFFFADFNRSWITCALGIWMIGYINIPFGLSSAIVAYFCGTLSKIFGRLPLIVVALILDISIQFTIALWPINSYDTWIYYLISLTWGTYDGIWLTISSALYGIIFPNDTEAAYSNQMFFQCFGYAVAFGYSYFLCADVKVYIMFSCLCVGVMCYFIMEFEHRKVDKQSIELEVVEVSEIRKNRSNGDNKDTYKSNYM